MGWHQGASHRRGASSLTWSGLLIAPALACIVVFVFFPTLYTAYLSTFHWDLLSPTPRFVGLANYAALPHASGFTSAVLNTVIYSTAVTVIVLPVGLALALLLDRGLPGTRFFRTVIFAPYVLPLVGSGIAWSWLYQPQYGLINQSLQLVHLVGPDWLGNSRTALLAVVVVSIWQYVGFYMLIFLGGLQSQDQALREAAQVDGASPRQVLQFVTFPLLAPSLLFASVISTIQSFQVFDQIYVMTGGGPGTATQTLVFYIYTQGFQFFSIGKASAVSVLLLLALAALTWTQFRLSRRWVVQ